MHKFYIYIDSSELEGKGFSYYLRIEVSFQRYVDINRDLVTLKWQIVKARETKKIGLCNVQNIIKPSLLPFFLYISTTQSIYNEKVLICTIAIK